MGDAYRTPALVCPSCGSPLREYDKRLVCDGCLGILIGTEDFVAAVHELDGESASLDVSDVQPTAKECPRCGKPMSTCALAVGKLKLPDRHLRCESDGVWLPQKAMTAVFARASRRGTRGRGDGRSYGGASGLPGGSSGMAGAMRSIETAFGSGAPATAGLAISQRRAMPIVHSVFVSAYKDRRLGCPSCKEQALDYRGDRWACPTCSGSFVENAALTAMVADMVNQPWNMPIVAGRAGERACPMCSEAMILEVLEAVTIDRCGAHGVWFDVDELRDLLQHAVTGEPATMGGWLKKLFHRHGTIEG